MLWQVACNDPRESEGLRGGLSQVPSGGFCREWISLMIETFPRIDRPANDGRFGDRVQLRTAQYGFLGFRCKVQTAAFTTWGSHLPATDRGFSRTQYLSSNGPVPCDEYLSKASRLKSAGTHVEVGRRPVTNSDA